MMRWSPHLTLIGELSPATLPQPDKVNDESGFNFSPEDLNELKTMILWGTGWRQSGSFW